MNVWNQIVRFVLLNYKVRTLVHGHFSPLEQPLKTPWNIRLDSLSKSYPILNSAAEVQLRKVPIQVSILLNFIF